MAEGKRKSPSQERRRNRRADVREGAELARLAEEVRSLRTNWPAFAGSAETARFVRAVDAGVETRAIVRRLVRRKGADV